MTPGPRNARARKRGLTRRYARYPANTDLPAGSREAPLNGTDINYTRHRTLVKRKTLERAQHRYRILSVLSIIFSNLRTEGALIGFAMLLKQISSSALRLEN